MPIKSIGTVVIAIIGTVTSLLTIERQESRTMKPDFDSAIKSHLACIKERDINAFKSHLTLQGTMYTVVQNGHAFKTTEELVSIHEQWFKDSNWTWNGVVVHKVVGEDMAMALVRYSYQPNQDTEAFDSWLVYVFKLEEGSWRIVHDQNTAVDYHAFARASGIEQ